MTVEIHWQGEEKTVTGKPGQSLLEIAHQHGIDLDHACGGVCACSTCHVKVEAGSELLSEQEEDEEDQLDDARDVSLRSRLGCQARILDGACGRIVVSIPSWNVNLAREAPH
ncbi:MAG: 2Fe-2S ferredoxin [Planctomycetota bacterium]|nr:MAG: 2Fe-2S ferredoxin [Planctomycetota bacterium]